MNFFEIADDRLTWRGNGETLVVEPWGLHSFRVRSALSHDVVETDWALLPPATRDCLIEVEGDTARVTNGNIVAVLRAGSHLDWQLGYHEFACSIEFQDAAGRTLLREIGDGGALKLRARDFRALQGNSHRIVASFTGPETERLVGMGQYQQVVADLKGCTLELAHRNSQASVPFVVSSAGYGFLWHNPAIGRATFARNRTEWVAESAVQLDYWITAAPSPAEIASAYSDATGHVPMMPEYGLGYWQCKLRYWNQKQLLEVAREHKRRGLPMDVIVADFFHWPKMGDFRFEDEFWPEPEAMIQELNSLGIELMVSVWPQISIDSENFPELRRNNHLVRADRGTDVQMSFLGPSMFLDVTNPAARQAMWDLCRQNYWDKGVRLFWLDEAEPEYGQYDFDAYRMHLGPSLEIGNIYPQAFSRAFFEGMQGAGQADVVNLVRCAWAGSQRFGALVWSGDIHSSFDDLARQVTAGVHMGVAGIPWFTTDIGGFGGGRSDDPAFHELLIRWFQYGTFCPVMRMHGDRSPSAPVTAADGSPRCSTGAGNELWSFGEDVYEILAAYVRLRERMRPYTRSLMREAHENGQPVIRGLFHGFPHEDLCWTITDEYLFGPDLLVAPVLEAGQRSRQVYLPTGATWTELASGEVHDGGQWVTAAAPLEAIPVFARDGACSDLVDSLTGPDSRA